MIFQIGDKVVSTTKDVIVVKNCIYTVNAIKTTSSNLSSYGGEQQVYLLECDAWFEAKQFKLHSRNMYIVVKNYTSVISRHYNDEDAVKWIKTQNDPVNIYTIFLAVREFKAVQTIEWKEVENVTV